MTPWRYMARLLGLNVPPWKAHALDYLEANGFRFCVDFGTENAVELARKHWRERKTKKGRVRITRPSLQNRGNQWRE